MVKETKYKPFKENDKVWLEGTHLQLPYKTMKLVPRRYGPFKVTAKVSDVAYRLKLPDNWKIHNIFHASLLTPYNETSAHGPNFLKPPPDLVEGEPEWEVEQILGDRTYRKKKQYLIRWKGYAPAHDSWQDESDIHALYLAIFNPELDRWAHTTAEYPDLLPSPRDSRWYPYLLNNPGLLLQWARSRGYILDEEYYEQA